MTRAVHHPLTTTTTSLHLFEGLFGSQTDVSKEDAEKELARFANLPAAQFDGVSEYVRQWAKLLETERSSDLRTPVKVVSTAEGAKILFQPKRNDYKNKHEERASEGTTNQPKRAPTADGENVFVEKQRRKPKQGGVEILVQQANGGTQVLARRCDMDEDTMVREMSEEWIIHGLKAAMKVWQKDHTK
jgi:hypothetical protein